MNKLKELRLQNNLSQKKLSDLTGIPLRSIQDLEADKVMHITTTRADYLYKLSQTLGVDMEYFFKN